MTNQDWLPTGSHWGLNISRKPVVTGPMIQGSVPKVVLHTTEGSGIDGADVTLRTNGDQPHFLIDSHGTVIQYVALSQYSKSLAHPAGTSETNRAGPIQIEMVGFADSPPTYYSKIGALCCLIEHRVDVPRVSDYPFRPQGHAVRVSPTSWPRAHGYFGHEHVPNNNHEDPGDFRIGKLFAEMAALTKAHAPG